MYLSNRFKLLSFRLKFVEQWVCKFLDMFRILNYVIVYSGFDQCYN